MIEVAAIGIRLTAVRYGRRLSTSSQMPDDDFFIRRFARARDNGDAEGARRIWEDACVRKFDLVAGLIRGHRFPGGGYLAPADREDAQTECMLRIIQMGENFRGTTGAEFRAAIRRACWFGCMDVGRDVLAYEQKIGGSLDARYEDSDAGKFDDVVERYMRDRADLAADAEQAQEQMQRDRELLHWAIGQVENENLRAVLELTFIEKLSGDAIAEQLGITPDNVYKRRERGLKKLEEILRDHRA